jgi:RimJ/RimL family protein N-acetyltransferase
MTTLVEAVTLAQAEALLAGDAVFTARFGRPVAPGYLDFPEVLPVLRDALTAGTPPEWYSHLIIDAASGTVVGFGGYKGPPVDGVVEIGYSVAPGWRRRGHATEATRLWIERARVGGVAVVCAHTLAEANASTRLLERCGFTKVEEFDDEEVGAVWRWELSLG